MKRTWPIIAVDDVPKSSAWYTGLLDAKNNPFLLEINTLPGFTPKSLLPEAANHAGIAFGPLVDRLAKRAFARGM